jgi:hypothetical protein
MSVMLNLEIGFTLDHFRNSLRAINSSAEHRVCVELDLCAIGEGENLMAANWRLKGPFLGGREIRPARGAQDGDDN